MKNMNVIQTEELYNVYQPLYRLDDQALFSYESLLRSKQETPPHLLFESARMENNVNLLDRISIESTLANFTANKDVLLFMNVLPSTLIEKDFLSFLESCLLQSNVNKSQLVLELNETVSEANHWNGPGLKRVIGELKAEGIQIAIDDVGTGLACNQKIIEIEPDFVKLDKYFGIGLSQSKLKQVTVKSYHFLCNGHAKLVLEGIEELEDLKLAKELGVDIGQGFYLGRPKPL